MGAQVDIVCKGRGKECEEGAENEGRTHRGQSQGAKTLKASEKENLGAHSPDRYQLSAEESRQKWISTK